MKRFITKSSASSFPQKKAIICLWSSKYVPLMDGKVMCKRAGRGAITLPEAKIATLSSLELCTDDRVRSFSICQSQNNVCTAALPVVAAQVSKKMICDSAMTATVDFKSVEKASFPMLILR